MSLDHLAPLREGTISVIVHKDSSIRAVDEEDGEGKIYGEYLKTLDEELLDLDPDNPPCRFVLKRTLSHKENLIVENGKATVSKKGKLAFNLSYQMEDVRQSIVRIDEAEGTTSKLKYKMIDGKVDHEFITWLAQVSLLNDLYNARQFAIEGSGKGPQKKS